MQIFAELRHSFRNNFLKRNKKKQEALQETKQKLDAQFKYPS